MIQDLYLLISAAFAGALLPPESRIGGRRAVCPLDMEEIRDGMFHNSGRHPCVLPTPSRLLSSITTAPTEHGPKLGFRGPEILTQLRTVRVISEEACVRCFNLIRLRRAEGKDPYREAGKRRSFFCIPGVASSTDQKLRRSIDLTEPPLQWCLSQNGSR